MRLFRISLNKTKKIYTMASNVPMVKLLNGYQEPVIGLGTFKICTDTRFNYDPEKFVSVIKEAIKIGYRHLDCACNLIIITLFSHSFTFIFGKGFMEIKRVWEKL